MNIKLAASPGGFELLIEHPALMRHSSIPEEYRTKTDYLIRVYA